MLRFALFSACLLFALAPEAQTLVVESATPTDYASGVSLTTDVSFTFSEPLVDITQGFGTFPTLVTFPTDGVEITATEQSDDRQTVTFSVSLQQDQRYVFLLLDAQSPNGRLERPFALNFTTASGAGFFGTGGTVTDASGLSLDGTIVALVTGDLATGDIEVAAMDVIETDAAAASYAIGPVGFGLYTVGAVRLAVPLADLDPTTLAYGLYDTDGDGVPDPVFSTSGVDVTVTPPDPFTALDGYDDAESTASGAVEEPRFIAIESRGVDEEGAAGAWRYSFESATTMERIDVLKVGLFSLPIESTDDVVGNPSLPVPFTDSDDALAVADAFGGDDFRAEHAAETVVVSLRGAPEPLAGDEPFWQVTYVARDAAGDVVDTFVVPVPFRISTAAAPEAASGVSLRFLSANPTSGRLSLQVVTSSTAEASLDILDARGRVVVALHGGPLAAGETRFNYELSASLAPGTYVVRFVTPEAIRTIPFVIAR